MRRLALFAILLLGVTGCTSPFSKGLDVCQEDSCFFDLARQAIQGGAEEQAREFCSAIQDDRTRDNCFTAIPIPNKNK